MTTPHLRHGAVSDVGLVRQANEDSFLVAHPIYLVADGMGGHQGGAIASSIVADEFSRMQVEGLGARAAAEELVRTMTRCQSRIRAWGETHGDSRGWHAGTTVAVAVAVEDLAGPQWLLANLGDSRIYREHEGALEQISVDHSVVQELMDAGRLTAAEAAVHPERHVITKALGSPEGVQPDFFLLPRSSAGRLVLCTDGISGMIEDQTMHEVLRSHTDPAAAADALLAAALEAGGRDNATVVVVDVVGLTTHDTLDTVHLGTGLGNKLGALP